MIPPDEPEAKSLIDSFIEKAPTTIELGISKKKRLDELLFEVFQRDFETMESWKEWHDHLHSLDIILACDYVGVNNRGAGEWARQKKMYACQVPANTLETLLIPAKTIEKMIILGKLAWS